MTLEKLFRSKVGSADIPEQQTRDLLEAADMELCLYLNLEVMEPQFYNSVAELAAIRYKKSLLAAGVKSRSYSEKDVSETVSYQTEADFQAQEDALFQRLSRFRRVVPHV